jgi:hypothetical protein
MLQMLDHGAAGFGTVSARLGAIRHVFVILELLAFLRACVARLRAPVTSRGRKRTLTCGQLGREGTVLGTIDTGVHRLDVLFFSVRDESRAMVEARIAGHLAISARLGALDEMLVVLSGLLGIRLDFAQSREPCNGPNDGHHHS